MKIIGTIGFDFTNKEFNVTSYDKSCPGELFTFRLRQEFEKLTYQKLYMFDIVGIIPIITEPTSYDLIRHLSNDYVFVNDRIHMDANRQVCEYLFKHDLLRSNPYVNYIKILNSVVEVLVDEDKKSDKDFFYIKNFLDSIPEKVESYIVKFSIYDYLGSDRERFTTAKIDAPDIHFISVEGEGYIDPCLITFFPKINQSLALVGEESVELIDKRKQYLEIVSRVGERNIAYWKRWCDKVSESKKEYFKLC